MFKILTPLFILLWAATAGQASTFITPPTQSAEAIVATWYRDLDGDGFGNSSDPVEAVDQPTGYVAVGGDCDDNNSAVNPGAPEICSNNIDDNCNGTTDEDMIPPVALCKPIIKVYLGSDGTVTVPIEALDNGSYDACGGGVLLSGSSTTFTCDDALKIFLVTMIVIDSSFNVNACQSTIKVADIMNPVAVCKQSITLKLDNNGQASLAPEDVDDGSFDNCSIAHFRLDTFTFNCTDIGLHTLNLRIEDASGNVATCTSEVNVVDKTKPTAVCNQFVVLGLDDAGQATLFSDYVDSGSYDQCSAVSFTLDTFTFDCSDLGSHNIRMDVEDGYGNSNFCMTTLTIIEKIKPLAACIDTFSVSLDSTGVVNLTPAMIDAGSQDNCSITDASVSPEQLNSTNFGINTITLTVADASGNESTCKTVVQVTAKLSGISTVLNPVDFLLAPNPAQDHVTLVCSSTCRSEHVQLTVMDLQGRVVLAQAARLQPLERVVLDISGLPGGAYFVQAVGVQAGVMVARFSKL